jgi:hypothetical protein
LHAIKAEAFFNFFKYKKVMNDRQESKLSRYQKVLDACNKYHSVYSDIPAFGQSVRQLSGNISDIVRAAQQQSGTITKGATAEKSAAFDRLVQQTVTMAKGLYVYAFRADNLMLLPKVRIPKSRMYRGYAMDAVIIAKNIAEEATSYADELLQYGIGEEELNALAETIEECEQLMNKPMETRDELKFYTGSLKQLFAVTDSTLYDELDQLIDLFRDSAPEFFTLYKFSRNIYPASQKKDEEKGEEK